MFDRIVVGYAGDQAGRDGVLLASQLAALCGSRVTVAIPYHPLLAAVCGDVAEQRARDELLAMLGPDPAIEQARFHWSNSSWPITALHGLADFERADLIVFGAAPERVGRRHVGLMERMVHGARCAVAVAPGLYADEGAPVIRRIGVGFDGSAGAHEASMLAMALAQRTSEPLRLVSGSGRAAALAGYAVLSPTPIELERDMQADAESAAQQLAAELSVGGRVNLEVASGDPVRMLLDASRRVDLLVLGSRGYGPLRHALLGSVSAEVMRRAQCPVVVLPRARTTVVGDSPLVASAQRQGLLAR